MAVGDVWQVKVYCRSGGQTAINVRHFRVASQNGTGATGLQVATFFDGLAATVYKAAISGLTEYRGVGAQQIKPTPPGLEWLSATLSGAGSGGASLLPEQVCGIITLNTGLAGRANRGRVYVPFPAEDKNSDTLAIPAAAYITLLDGVRLFWTTTRDVPDAVSANRSQLIPVIYHRAGGTTTDIVGGASRAKWATQRRRGNYGRPNVSPI